MTKKQLSYADQLKHPNWQRKRLEMLEAAKWECTKCGDKETTLHVHHRKYVKGRMAWEYEARELAVLCENCHEDEHHFQEDIEVLLNQQWLDKGMSGKEVVVGFLAGFLCPFSPEGTPVRKIAERAIERQWPFFELGFMVAALGPDDLKAAVKAKIARGDLPSDSKLMDYVLGEDE